MKSLYILNNPANLEQCLSAMAPDDALLLIEDAVLLCHQHTLHNSYILEEDLIARGFATKQSHWQAVDYPQFVQLTLQYDKTVTWL
ncbi:sulfurtransferase complex subunit TusB [Kangiella shandongensis]|uniref:sulfurtransferase complex subunit TusB n=1 Tax=Kangiella shandongensis TaxID=2763258 RepID=UPI001CC15289|nr:sulfurtransferase complex subunit TusB [Kangiella shandongensis]